MSKLPNKPLLTRKGAVRHINHVIGVPLKLSSFAKMAMLGRTPEPAAFYGKVELYDPEAVERWAASYLLAPTRTDLRLRDKKATA